MTASARASRRLNLWLTTLFLLVIAVALNVLSFRNYRKWDWTEEGYFTLSGRAIQELESLDARVDFYLLLSPSDPKYTEVDELLDRSLAFTDQLTVHHVDPDREAAEFEALAQRFGLRSSAQALDSLAAVVTSGERRWTITRDDLLGFDFGGFDNPEEAMVDVKAEQALVQALVQVTTGRPTKVCVTSGHGEWSVDTGSERTVSALANELRRENVHLESIDGLRSQPVPADCDAVFVIGPTQAFGEEEVDRLRRYINDGGNALLALDPVLTEQGAQLTGFESMLHEYGVALDATLVFEADPARLLTGSGAGPFGAISYGDHPTVAPLGRGETVFMLARSVRAEPNSPAVELVFTSEASWAEADLAGLGPGWQPEPGEGEVRGPVSLAVASRRREVPAPAAQTQHSEPGEEQGGEQAQTGGRLIVVGDAEWLAGELLRDPRNANSDLALMWTGWLTRRETLIAIPSKQVSAVPMRIHEGHLWELSFRLMLLMPASMVLLGFAMRWTRKS